MLQKLRLLMMLREHLHLEREAFSACWLAGWLAGVVFIFHLGRRPALFLAYRFEMSVGQVGLSDGKCHVKHQTLVGL